MHNTLMEITIMFDIPIHLCLAMLKKPDSEVDETSRWMEF